MRNVTKRRPGPPCLTTAEAVAKSAGKLTAVAWTNEVPPACVQTVRDAIYADQQGLCCYCGGKLLPPRADPNRGPSTPGWSVEHLSAREHHPGRALDWGNLLGVCNGKLNEQLHCDKARQSAALNTSPFELRDLRDVFSVRLQGPNRGEIIVNEPAGSPGPVQADIHTLNLNHPALVSNRRQALIKLAETLARDDSPGRIRGLYNAHTQAPELPEYAHVLAAYLRHKARQKGIALP